MGFLFPVLGIGHPKNAHVVSAHVHAEEVSGGDGAEFTFGGFVLLVETCGMMVMAVHRVEIPIFKFLALGVGIRDALLHLPGEKVVLRGDVSESAGAFEGFEKMTGVNVSNALICMKLEELLAGSGTAQTAQYAGLTILDV